MPFDHRRLSLARFAIAIALVIGLHSLAGGVALGAQPEPGALTQVGAPAAKGGNPPTIRGYDVSYPQCGVTLPANRAFAIVGVNGGRVFSGNPCLAAQLAWAGDAAAELYANTGNPGPALSSFWPLGQTSPRLCDAANPDTADCAYDYGWNAAANSYARLEQAYAARGITKNPNLAAWWFDVETTNSWRSNTSLNVAALQGGFDHLRSRGVTRLGFYSTTVQWGTITGGTKIFSAYPSWGAGSPSEKAAKQLCATTVTSFTGGRLAMVQYPFAGLDADIRC